MKYPPLISTTTWLMIKSDTRNYMRRIFQIPKSGYTEVFDGMVLCDGTMLEDLYALTTEKMQEYLDSKETDFHKLLNSVIEKIEAPEIVHIVPTDDSVIATVNNVTEYKEDVKATNASEVKGGTRKRTPSKKGTGAKV